LTKYKTLSIGEKIKLTIKTLTIKREAKKTLLKTEGFMRLMNCRF
jgi:hypothetical protein